MKKQKATFSVLYRLVSVLAAVVVVMVLYVGAMTAYDFGYRLFAESPMSLEPGRDITFVIEEGASVSSVAEQLEGQGIIRDALIFKIQNKLSHYSKGFQAGTYTLNTSMDNDEIMAVLSGEAGQEKE